MSDKFLEAARRIRQHEGRPQGVSHARAAPVHVLGEPATREALIEEGLAAIDEALAAVEEPPERRLRGMNVPPPEEPRPTNEEVFPGEDAFRLLLDKQPLADELEKEGETPFKATRGLTADPKRKATLAKLKELYGAVKGFLSKLRADLLATQTQLNAGAPVSLAARAPLDGDVLVVVRAETNASLADWADAKDAITSWRKNSVGALVLVAAVLGKAAEIIASIVTFMAHPLTSVKQIYRALLELYKTLSDALALGS